MREITINKILETQKESKALCEDMFGRGTYDGYWYTAKELNEMADEQLLEAFLNVMMEAP